MLDVLQSSTLSEYQKVSSHGQMGQKMENCQTKQRSMILS